MHRTIQALAVALPLLVLAPISASAGCGVKSVCRDTAQSFIGTVISEGLAPGETGVRLAWRVRAESDIHGYRIGRYDCANAEQCAVWTHLVMATGTCREPQAYSVVDVPPGPIGFWRYRLEVWGADGSLACQAEIVPR